MRKILLILVVLVNLYGLDINEAVQRAMDHNPSLKEKQFLVKSSHEQTNVAWSGYKPKVDLAYGYSEFSKENFVGVSSASSASATLSYNLFNGFLDKYNLKQSEENENVALYTYQASKADLKLEVYLAYINYLRSKEQITISQDTISLLEQQLTDAKNFYDQGLFAKNDYLQVDVELSAAQQALLSSKRNVKISFYRLKRLMGSELDKDEKIQDLNREQKELHLSTLKDMMLSNRSELKVLNAQKNALNYTYKGSASAYYPKLDASLKYQAAGVDPLPNGNGPNFQINDQVTATINANWNLYQGGSDEANRASLLYQTQASNERLADLYLELDFQLEVATESYTLAQNQIIVATKALSQAKENFRITKNQFDENIANTTLMLDAQRFLARSQVDYYSAFFALYDAMGEIERVVEEDVF